MVSHFTELTHHILRQMLLPPPGDDKEARGRVLVMGGSATVPGAVRLAGEAALRAGAGKLQIATVRSVAPAMAIAVPEAMVMPLQEDPKGEAAASLPSLETAFAQSGAVLLGPGMQCSDLLVRLAVVAAQRCLGPLVLDAGSLNNTLVAPEGRPSILTPHAGEMAELCEVTRAEIEKAPLEWALRLAHKLRSVVVLKGPDTYVVDSQGQAWLHRGGVPGLGTSGSGDVLSGLIVGLAARGATPIQAALWGVWVHAQAGRDLSESVGELGFLARELPGLVPGILSRFPYAEVNPG